MIGMPPRPPHRRDRNKEIHAVGPVAQLARTKKFARTYLVFRPPSNAQAASAESGADIADEAVVLLKCVERCAKLHAVPAARIAAPLPLAGGIALCLQPFSG